MISLNIVFLVKTPARTRARTYAGASGPKSIFGYEKLREIDESSRNGKNLGLCAKRAER
jgi:hypothetical protein